MSHAAANNTTDPNALFQMLVKEAHDAEATQAAAAAAAPAGDKPAGDKPAAADTTKIANNTGAVFDLAFFDKLAANDAEAGTHLNTFVSQALEQGHDPDAIGNFVAQMEADARGTPAAANTDTPAGDKPADAPADTEVTDAFDAAVEEAEAEAIEKAIDDELEHNPLAKAAGVTRETVEAWMIGEKGGEAYFHGRQAVNDIIEKIASQVIPSDDMVAESLKALKDAGLDVAAVETEVETIKKEAAAQPASTEGEAAKKARELAAAEQAVVESLTVLKCAGFDVDALVKQVEEKKKMSGGKKALIAGGSLAALGGGGYLAKRHSGTIATKAVGAMNALKSKMGK